MFRAIVFCIASFIAASFSIGTGCRHNGWTPRLDRHYCYWIDPTFNTAERQDIIQAIRMWETDTEQWVTFEEVMDKTVADIQYRSSFTELLTDPANDQSTVLGRTQKHQSRSSVLIARDISEHNFQWVSLHETGHALGLGHSNEASDDHKSVTAVDPVHAHPAVMCSRSQCSSLVVTCQDAEMFCEVWGCRPELLKACVGQNGK